MDWLTQLGITWLEWTMFIALVVLLLFQGIVFVRLLFHKHKAPVRDLPVSIVICANNEGDTLERNLPAILGQDHQEFEVLVVNDGSQDETGSILKEMKAQHSNLTVIELPPDDQYRRGKKMALGIGVKSAKYEHVVLTDADCWPPGHDWLSLMAAGFSKENKIVIGHSPYEQQPGLTNLLERFDGTLKAMTYLGFAEAGMPYMGVGRNLAYEKKVFFSAKNLQQGQHLMSGDDDLLINAVAKARNTSVVIDAQSYMTTRATEDIATWWRRKRRHYTTATHYKFVHKLLLMLLPLARLAFWVSLFWQLVHQNWIFAGIGFGVYLLLVHSITLAVMHKLAGKTLLLWSLPLELVFLVLDPIIYLTTLLSPPRRWK